MPLLPDPPYTPAFPFTNGHVHTIFPTLFRRLPPCWPQRERLWVADGDFLDIDWHRHRRTAFSTHVAVISHGLEGHSRRGHVLGMAAALAEHGWDVICLNFRGCSGEMNRLPRLYHSGVTDDLHAVLSHGLSKGRYRHAVLIGFSMGGNQTLKYLGEAPEKVPREVGAAVVFSVPVQLGDAAALMACRHNRVYMEYFLSRLRRKIRHKARMFPHIYDTTGLDAIKTFATFDDKYTGPVHGFGGAAEYYARCSAGRFLAALRTPTLLVQAQDDPFLPQSCYPTAEASDNPHLFLEMPRFGGHVGFVGRWRAKMYWMEERTLAFLHATMEEKPRLFQEERPAEPPCKKSRAENR